MAWVIDLDGVMWVGRRPIPGSADAVSRLLADGEDVAFVTNNSAAPPDRVEHRLAEMGVDAAGRVVTSAMAAATLVTAGERVLVCGGPGVIEALDERDARVVEEPGEAETVIVGLAPDLSYDLLSRASLAVRAGARLVATNDDATYPSPRGQIPGAGAILAAVVAATGATPVVAGKPHEPMAALVRARLGPSGVVVGDRPDTDGEFARTLGYRFALVLSGVTGADDLPTTPAADVVADDLDSAVAAVDRERERGRPVGDGPR